MAWKEVAEDQTILPQEQQLGTLGQVGQFLGSTGTWALENLAALPGNISDLLNRLTLSGATKLATTIGIPGAEKFAKMPQEEREQLLAMASRPPTISEIHKVAQEKLPSVLTKEPESEAGKFIRNVAGALPAFYLPGGGFINATTRALGSEAGRKLAKDVFNLGEVGQFFGSVAGAGFASGLMTPRNLKNLALKQYNAFEKSIPKNARQSTTFVKEAFKKVEDMDLIPQDKKLIQDVVIDRLETSLNRGSININQAWRDKKYLAKIARETPNISKEAKRAIFELGNGIKKDTLEAGKLYPGLAINDLVGADSIYHGLQNLSPLRKFLRKYVTPSYGLGVAAGELLGPRALKEVAGGLGAKAFGAGLLARGATEFIEPIIKSPAAARYMATQTVPQIISGTVISSSGRERPKGKWREITA